MITQRPLTENLIQYLKDGSIGDITDNQYVDSAETPNTSEEYVLLVENGGTSENWPSEKQQISISVRVRAKSEYTARTNSYDVWNYLQTKEHNVTLPGSELYTGSAEINVAHLLVENRPTYLGVIDGYHFYLFSISITYFAT